jgi:hypothetical protein
MRRRVAGEVMRRIVVLALALGCSRSHELEALQREADAVALLEQPVLDALVARTRVLKRELRGNLPGWQDMLRTAELANDLLGLEPFTQATPPGPGWRPSPASLLGIAGYVRVQARELAARGNQHALQFLVDDERRRYARGIEEVDGELARVEAWLAANR